jgi:putative transcriptional regulator
MITEDYGSRVKALRKTMNLSQEDLAREIGVSLSTVQRWEKNVGRPIRLARIELEKRFKKAGLSHHERPIKLS